MVPNSKALKIVYILPKYFCWNKVIQFIVLYSAVIVNILFIIIIITIIINIYKNMSNSIMVKVHQGQL